MMLCILGRRQKIRERKGKSCYVDMLFVGVVLGFTYLFTWFSPWVVVLLLLMGWLWFNYYLRKLIISQILFDIICQHLLGFGTILYKVVRL